MKQVVKSNYVVLSHTFGAPAGIQFQVPWRDEVTPLGQRVDPVVRVRGSDVRHAPARDCEHGRTQRIASFDHAGVKNCFGLRKW